LKPIWLVSFIFAVIRTGAAVAQESHPVSAPLARERLLAAAKAADLPEAGADVLLRALERNVIANSNDRALLAEEAFRLANLAWLHVPRQPHGRTDTVETYSAVADQYGITRMDLQARAVQILLKIDKARGVELFQQIQPSAPKTDCNSPEVYGFRHYFLALGVVLEEVTDVEETEQILRKQVALAKTPSQFALLAGVLAHVQPAVRDVVAPIYAAALTHASGQFDSRSFEESAMNLLEGAGKLAGALHNRGASSAVRDLISGVRLALVRQFNGSQCQNRGTYSREQILFAFNQELQPVASDPAVEPILPKDIASGKRDGGSWTVTPFWETEAARKLNHRMAVLAHTGMPVDRESEAWKQSAAKIFEDVRKWDDNPEPEDPVLQFCQKATLLRSLLQIRLDPAPVATSIKRDDAYRQLANLPDRTAVLKEIIQTLAGPKGVRIKSANRGAWLRTAEDLTDYFWHSRRQDWLHWSMTLAESGDPTLRAFAVLAEVSAFPSR